MNNDVEERSGSQYGQASIREAHFSEVVKKRALVFSACLRYIICPSIHSWVGVLCVSIRLKLWSVCFYTFIFVLNIIINSMFLCSRFADFKLETLGDAAQIPRLASSLSACAQLNTLSAVQRTWALHRLRKLVTSEAGPVIDVPALFGYNLMYDQPLIKMKHAGSQRMSAVRTSSLIMCI